MGSGGEIATLIMMSIGTLMTIVAVCIPYWKRNDPEDTINDSIFRHEGLWITCQAFQTGNWDCDDFNRFFLGLPVELQVSRGFAITSIVFSIFGIICMVIGMDSVPCGSDDKSTNRRTRLIAGILVMLAGLLIFAAVSWYANNVRIQHEFATAQRLASGSSSAITRFIFGTALFIGWVGGAFLLIAGLLGLCTGCGGDSYEDQPRNYVYRPPKSVNTGQEYV